MNLKLISQVLSQTVVVFGLGLIISPHSAQGAVDTGFTTENLDLSRPTLLVNKTEEVSMLVENSQNLKTELPSSVSVADVNPNTSYTIAKNERVTNLFRQASENPSFNKINAKDLKVQTVTSPTLVAQNITPSNRTSLPIAVELPSQPTSNEQFISIPVEVESPITPENNSINIPVNVVSSSSQTENPYDRNVNNPQQPTLISNTRNFERANTPQNNRIINPSSERLNREENQPSQNLVSSIPIQIEYYNPMIAPSAGQMVSPDLPQINSPEPYLPEGNRPFNGYIWPAKGVFTSGYGWRWGRMHKGIDIAAPVGTPILAAADGEVISSGWNSGGFGNLVRIRHFDGTVTLYAHNSKILVRPGEFVKQGQHIANMGSTGFSTGPHLHFEIHPNGQGAVNPIALLPKR